jgi:hypothetical protein
MSKEPSISEGDQELADQRAPAIALRLKLARRQKAIPVAREQFRQAFGLGRTKAREGIYAGADRTERPELDRRGIPRRQGHPLRPQEYACRAATREVVVALSGSQIPGPVEVRVGIAPVQRIRDGE